MSSPRLFLIPSWTYCNSQWPILIYLTNTYTMLIVSQGIEHKLLLGGTNVKDKVLHLYSSEPNMQLPYGPTTLEHLSQRNENSYSHKNLHTNVYNSFVYNSQNWEKPRCPLIGEQLTAVHTYHGILFSK